MPWTAAHRAPLLLALGGVLLALTGCQLGSAGTGPLDGVAEPTSLIVSTSYRPDEPGAVATRLSTLGRTIDDLRATTGSGWVGRQDDVTGYLAELYGGRFPRAGADEQFAEPDEVIDALLAAYGLELFGVSPAEVAPDASGVDDPDGSGAVSVRAPQTLGGVPVLDGNLVFSVTTRDGAVVHGVQGRVFPALDASTTPGLTAAQASRAAIRLTGGTPQGEPELIVLPLGRGALAWQVVVAGVDAERGPVAQTDGTYYLDASTGAPLDFRSGSAESRPASTGRRQGLVIGGHGTRLVRAPAAEGDSVDVSGSGPGGQQLSGKGTRVAGGVQLLDTTVSTYSAGTGRGGIYTYTMGDRYEEKRPLPGDAYVQRDGTQISDPEALAAHVLAREIYDYYQQVHGRDSWDGNGASLISVVNYGDNSYCNSRFDPNLAEPAMVYGNPCQDGNGLPQEVTEVEIDTAAHEITHGVTNSSSHLIYAGQSGALNESFSDYFGNVIGNRYKNIDTASLMEDSCAGFSSETYFCTQNPEGFSTRYLLNGNTFDDYLFLLNPPGHLAALGVGTQDQGGVHLNSSIWNNALWSIRARLAKIDGVSGNESALVADFDAAVYDALVHRLGPTSGFFDARAAVEQAITASGADPVLLRVAREQFAFNKICSGCSAFPAPFGDAVSASTGTEVEPVVSGDRVAWLLRGQGALGFATTQEVGGSPRALDASPTTWQVVFAGGSPVRLDGRYRLVRSTAGGEKVVATVDDSTYEIGIAGSDAGAAWVAQSEDVIGYVDSDGTVTTSRVPRLAGQRITALGTGDGTIAFGTDGGQIWYGQAGGRFTKFGSMEDLVVSVAAHGDLVAAVDRTGEAAAVDTSTDRVYPLSDQAAPMGVAISASYVVWADRVGALGGGVAESERITVSDTDLMLFSPATGSTYPITPSRGQQGYPAMSGDRLVWQESGYGGDDVFTATLKPGL